MIDREKVIEGLEICINRVPGEYDCAKCSYESYGNDCEIYLTKDAITLLKEQEAVKPVLDEQTGRIWLCGKCGSYVGFEDNDPHDLNEFDKYCRDCGTPVLWKGR